MRDWPPKNARDRIIEVLDKEDSWVHVMMNYISATLAHDSVKIRRNGLPDRRDNRGRLCFELNNAIGDVMDIRNIIKNRR